MGVGGVTRSPLERKIQWGGGSNWKKTLRGEGMDIFWNHTLASENEAEMFLFFF